MIGLTATEVIARQARRIEALDDMVKDLTERIRRARLRMTCVGGPLNDNVKGYTKDQLFTFHRIENDLEGCNADPL